ncbi:DUF5022 domain-containing protein [Enterocloster bolteae]|uniref:DUF5022 domain-containing protein n=1 Tax=Enterocloster bolteae TaxID=208479 RepID=UPI0028DB0E06|nr:DUF5022 domain-containing protein [Enterocloster bolteae]
MRKIILTLGAIAIGLSINFSGIAYADEIQQIDDGYIYSDQGQEYMMQRADIQLSDEAELERFIQVAGLEKETVEDLHIQSQLAIEREDNTAIATIYYPVNTTRATAAPVYSTYNGRQFKVELIYYTGMNTGWQMIAQRANTYQVAGQLAEGIVDIADSGLSIPLTSGALTALQVYENVTGSRPIIGSYEDYIQARVLYDVYNKHTYIQSQGTQPTWLHGAYTRRINFKEIGLSQYYFNYYGGRTVDTNYRVNRQFQTPHYDNAVPTVYQRAQSNLNMNQLSEDINIRINNQRIVF